MKKTITFYMVLLSLNLIAQQLPNNSFENWTTESFDDLNYYFDGSEEGNHNVFKDSDSYEGNYAIKMLTVEDNDEDLIAGFFINFNPDNFDGGIAYTSHVDSVKFHYKAHLIAQDSANFLAYFKKDGEIIGGKIIKLAADKNTDDWTEYSFATDMEAGVTPDTLLIGAASSNVLGDVDLEEGSWFMLDDIEMISNTLPEPDKIPNNDFEDWNTIEINHPEDFETSLQWQLIPPSIVRIDNESTDGQYSIKLINVLENTDEESRVISGLVTNGHITDSWPFPGGMALSEVPNSVSYDVKAKRAYNEAGGITFTFKKDGNEVYSNGKDYESDITDFIHEEIALDITEPVDTLVMQIWNGDIEGSELQIDNIELHYPLGIQNNMEISELKAFPVPAVNTLKFEIKSLKNSPLRIEITGMNGKKIIEKEFSLSSGTHQLNMDISQLPPGTYIYNIITGNNVIHKTFLKQ